MGREERRANKKPFKETKLGIFLADKAPKILDTVGDLLPDKGALGIVKNLIDKEPKLSAADKAEALRLANEELKLYLEDQQNARSRQVEMAKAGIKDPLHLAVGFVVLGSFVGILLYGFFAKNPNMEIYFHNMGVAEGAMLTVLTFYFGNTIYLKKKLE